MSYGPVINSVGDEFFVPISSQTLGISNSAPVVGPIVVTEFNYHWSSNGTGLFLEFVNITDEWIPLFDLQNPQNTWQLYAGPMFFLPQDTLIPPRAIFLVVAEDPESFRAKHAVPEEVPIFGRLTYDEHYLTAYGIHLFRPSGVINVPGYTGPRMIPVESINFERQFPWPSAADGAGWSLQRLATHEFANDPKNWRATPEMSPGRPNFAFPIDGWRAWHFSRSELGDPAVSGDEADPDNDGLNNLSEYAFGLDPKSPGKLPVRVGITQGRLTVAVAKYGGATDVDVFAESAGSLSGPWSSGDVESEMIWPDLIMWDRTQNASSRFLRIRVRRQ